VTRPSPILALRAAIRTRLVADAALLALLGGPRVYDEAPRGIDPPYVIFGDVTADDWSTGDIAGHRQTLSLVVWSSQGGDSQALSIVGELAELLADAPLVLAGHRLVLLRVAGEAVSRPEAADPSAGLRRATLRLVALTEPA
jgi:hypothetical protein